MPITHSFLRGFVINSMRGNFLCRWVCMGGIGNKEDFVIAGRGRLLRYFIFVMKSPLILKSIITYRPSILFVRNDPVFGIFCLIVSRFLRIKFVYQLSHLKEEQELESIKGLNAIFIKISRSIRNYLINACDLFIPISHEMLYEFPNSVSQKSFPIGLGVDSTLFEKVTPKLIDSDYCIYIGTHHRTRRLDIIIDAFALFKKRNPKTSLKLLMIGGDRDKNEKKALKDRASKKLLSSCIVFLDDMPREEVLEYVKGANFGFCVIPKLSVNKTLSPTKLFEYIGLGVPAILSTGIPAQDKVASLLPILPKANTVYEISVAMEICNSELQNDSVRTKLQEDAKNLFAYDNYVDAFLKTIKSLKK